MLRYSLCHITGYNARSRQSNPDKQTGAGTRRAPAQPWRRAAQATPSHSNWVSISFWNLNIERLNSRLVIVHFNIFSFSSCTRWEDGTNEGTQKKDMIKRPTSGLDSLLCQGKPRPAWPSHTHLFPVLPSRMWAVVKKVGRLVLQQLYQFSGGVFLRVCGSVDTRLMISDVSFQTNSFIPLAL